MQDTARRHLRQALRLRRTDRLPYGSFRSPLGSIRIDSGFLACLPTAAVDGLYANRMGQTWRFVKPFRVGWAHGTFIIGHIRIGADPEPRPFR